MTTYTQDPYAIDIRAQLQRQLETASLRDLSDQYAQCQELAQLDDSDGRLPWWAMLILWATAVAALLLVAL